MAVELDLGLADSIVTFQEFGLDALHESRRGVHYFRLHSRMK